MALYRFGMAFNQEYSRLKTQRGLLDYNDLIIRTNNLLAASEAAQWVAWKLDNGIQHLLIDEAQDTSPAQWKLLRRLVDEFFDGEGASPISHRGNKLAANDVCRWGFQTIDLFLSGCRPAGYESESKRAVQPRQSHSSRFPRCAFVGVVPVGKPYSGSGQ
jgi:ATP-dependent helicase/nuclease subunit A